MNKYKFLLFISFIVNYCTICAQEEEFTPLSPSNIATIKASSSDVDLYSGRTNVHIPIYTIKEGDISINIGLKYNGGNGIKVQEISGEAGLGWALLAGGVITRSSLSSKPNNGSLKSGTIDDIKTTLPYSNPIIEFQSSIGGKIIFDANNKPKFLNEQGYRIDEDYFNGGNNKWVITAPNGDKYYFGDNNAKEYFVNTQGSTQSISKDVNSWYLTKIVSSKGDEVIFNYEKTGKIIKYSYWDIYRSKTTEHGVYNFTTRKFENKVGSWNTVTKEVPTPSEEIHLSEIISSSGRVTFTYTTRDDLPNSLAIYEIKVLTKKNDPITSFIFDMDYFKSNIENPTLRLKLKGIKQKDRTGDISRSIATFTYNETENLPARNSEKIDYWGFYNNNSTGKYFVSENADRNSNLIKCQANILTAIQWESGGITNYKYELNSYRKNNIDYAGGGLRIVTITESNGTSGPKVTKFAYTSNTAGQNITSGLHHTWYDIRKGYVSNSLREDRFMRDRLTINEREPAIPLQRIADVSGIIVGYSKVKVIIPDNSAVEYNFSNYDNYPDIPKFYSFSYFFFRNREIRNFNEFIPEDKYNGLSDISSNNHNRGRLLSKIILNDKGQTVKAIRNKYNFRNISNIYGSKSQIIKSINPDDSELKNSEDFCQLSVFDYKIGCVQLLETIEENYYGGSTQPAQSVKTTYEYDTSYPFLITKRKSCQSDGYVFEDEYHHNTPIMGNIYDPTNKDLYNELKARNIITPIIQHWKGKYIEVIDGGHTYYNNLKTLTLSFNRYKKYGNLILPSSYEVSYSNNPAKQPTTNEMLTTKVLSTIVSYTSNGKVQEVYDNINDITTTTIWGYNQHYPIINIIGATFSQVRNIIGDPDLFKMMENTIESDVIKYSTKLRNELPNSLITATVYEPLVGIKIAINSKGLAEYYQYDGFGRLSAVLDKDGNILKTYCYNTAGQQIDCATVKTIYFSSRKSNVFTKLDCPINNGTQVEYIVEAGKYFSTISQIDADKQAYEDIWANGQAYANKIGKCETPSTSIEVDFEIDCSQSQPSYSTGASMRIEAVDPTELPNGQYLLIELNYHEVLYGTFKKRVVLPKLKNGYKVSFNSGFNSTRPCYDFIIPQFNIHLQGCGPEGYTRGNNEQVFAPPLQFNNGDIIKIQRVTGGRIQTPIVTPPTPEQIFDISNSFTKISENLSLNGNTVSGTLTVQAKSGSSYEASPNMTYVGGIYKSEYIPNATRTFTSGNWSCEMRWGAAVRLYIKWIGSGSPPVGTPITFNINYQK